MIDSQDVVAAEHGRVIHDRNVDHGIGRGGAISKEQERPLSVLEQLEDRP
ncbi:hypothetical protein [Streptomyces sp. NPDC101165]